MKHNLLPDAVLAEDRYEYAEHWLATHGNTTLGQAVFDIGAGQGRMRPAAEAAGLQWHGFDLFPADDTILSWDLNESCPISNMKAQYVLMMDVIEHLPNPWTGMRNVTSSVAAGGHLLMTMPNPRWSRSRVHYLRHGTISCFTPHDLKWNHHVFTPWQHIVQKLLSDFGWEITEYVVLDRDEARLKNPLNPLRLADAAMRAAIDRLDPSARGMSYALTAKLVSPSDSTVPAGS